MEELPSVLWAYRTTPGRPAGNIPFSLAYGMDAVIPTKIGLPTIWIAIRGRRNENQELERNLDWADEVRENVAIWMAAYQQRHDLESSRSKHLSLKKFSKTPLKRGTGSSKQIGKTPTLFLKQAKAGLIIYKS